MLEITPAGGRITSTYDASDRLIEKHYPSSATLPHTFVGRQGYYRASLTAGV